MDSLGRFLAVLLVVGGGFATSLALLTLYRRDVGRGETTVSPGDTGASWPVLVLVSLFGLFLELLLIRWVSSEIRIFAYFKNFVLIACFLGFGLGFQLSRRRVQPLALALPLVMIAAAIELPWRPLRELVDVLPLYLGSFSEVHYWGVPLLSLEGTALVNLSGALLVSVSLFGLVAMTFVPIGQLIGWHIEESARGIRAYSVNLLASLAGILLFSALAYSSQPPLVWFLVAGVLAVVLFWSHRRMRWVLAISFVLCVALVGLGERGPEDIYWSPYQKLAISSVNDDGELLSYRSDHQQQLVPADPQPLGFLCCAPSRRVGGSAVRVQLLQPAVPVFRAAVVVVDTWFGDGERRGSRPAERKRARDRSGNRPSYPGPGPRVPL